jgi:predicted metalloprotease with PDZ domain
MKAVAASSGCCCVLAILVMAAPAPIWADEQRPIELSVDAREAPRRIYHARLVIPARPGALTLCYPKWLPGTHSPSGPISNLAEITIRAGGKSVPWQRDEVDAYLLHCRVPDGADKIDVGLTVLMSASGRWSPTPRLAAFNWNQVVLYPRGTPARRLPIRAQLRLPEGWKLGTALPIEKQDEAGTRFATASLETLIDSPVLCGEYFREIPIRTKSGPPHYVILAADGEAALDLSPGLKTGCDRLVGEAEALFGGRHYNSYRFLLALSDHLSFSGLEHHESSDNHGPERALLEAGGRDIVGYLFAHEYVHSWCGKYRRPADMITADFNQPQRTRLLWVYEGLTDYLGYVLAGRAGLWTPQTCRDHLALVAETMRNQRGRSWRSLEDVAIAAHSLGQAPGDWTSRRRSTFDYYWEGVLLWLEVDMLIREKTGGKRSLDDFCRRFFGGNGGPIVNSYTFADLSATLAEVAPYDWKSFLTRRVAATAEKAPLEGIRLAGWRLSYGPEPTGWSKTWAGMRKQIDLSSSLGLSFKPDGGVGDVIPQTPADKAGIAPGMKLLAVNGRRWSEPRLLDALKAAPTTGKVELLLENGDLFRTFTLDYRDGPRFPRLERLAPEGSEQLSRLLAPLVKDTPSAGGR